MQLSWPPQLHIAKNVAVGQASQFISSKPNCIHTRLMIQYASQEAQVRRQQPLLAPAGGPPQPRRGWRGARPGTLVSPPLVARAPACACRASLSGC